MDLVQCYFWQQRYTFFNDTLISLQYTKPNTSFFSFNPKPGKMFAVENGLQGDPRLQAISDAIRVVPHFPKQGNSLHFLG